MSEERVTAIEERLAHQEHSIQSLSDTLYQQQQIVERLQSQVMLLADHLRVLSESAKTEAPIDETPPHY